MDLQEIESRLVSKFSEGEDYYHINDAWDTWTDYINRDPVAVDGLGEVKVVQHEGGEGDGSSQSIVVAIRHLDGSVRYYRKSGYYSSFDGSDWDRSFVEVKPIQKTITLYVDA